jgi:hypothetical protein
MSTDTKSEQARSNDGTPDADTVTVRVRDRASESPWGVGLTRPITKTVTISAFCPTCGARRGEPRGLNSCDDGAFYWVQVWDNPCGHVDYYADVLAEARERASHHTGSTKAGGTQR